MQRSGQTTGRVAALGVAFALTGAMALAPVRVGSDDQPAAARAIVKLRPPLARAVESGLPDSLRVTGTSSGGPMVRGFMERHDVRTMRPVHPRLLEARRRLRVTERGLMASVRGRFPARASRRVTTQDPPEMTRTYVLELTPGAGTTLEDALEGLRGDPDVEYAEEDRVVAVDIVPNDPFYASSGTWGQSYDDLWGLKKIGAAAAWDATTGQGVTVAIVDTGIDYTHPDLAGNVWFNDGEIPGNGVDDDGNGYVDDVRGWDFIGPVYTQPAADPDPVDDHGHGTHVAGTVAAEGDNGVGVVGVAWRAKVMALKGLDRSGTGWNSILADAITYAADNGADVINASWGGPGTSQVLKDAVDYAYSLGVVVVCAAGNDDSDVLDFYPAHFANVIAVAATTPSDYKASFSNWGSRIDVAAPGVDILSLRAAGTTMGSPVDAQHTRADGTSMASPHVAGLAALVLAGHPAYSVEEVRQVLRVSAQDRGAAGFDLDYGHGRINAAAAVVVPSVLEARIKAPADGTRIAGPVTLEGVARGAGFAGYSVEWGPGTAPTAWTLLAEAATPVDGGQLGVFDPSALPDGIYSLRLTARDGGGRAFVDRIQLVVDFVAVTSPVPPAVASVAAVFKPGAVVVVEGRADGPSFQSFRLEWARGLQPTSGWSDAGMTPTGGGAQPVAGGVLGAWDTAGITPAGHYTIRLLVTNDGFTSEARTIVYLEPDLLSAHWPKWLDGGPSSRSGLLPARDASGQTRLVMVSPQYLGGSSPSRYRSFSVDGSQEDSLPLNGGTYHQLAVGNIDGVPGDEVVVGDDDGLRVVHGDNTFAFLALPIPARFKHASPILEDLDGDGGLEILAVGDDYDTQKSHLFAWRGDGTPLGGGFPVPIADANFYSDPEGPRFLVHDLDGDGAKEILLQEEPSPLSTSFKLVAADGSPKAWTSPILPGRPHTLVVTDFERDGRLEIVCTTNGLGLADLHVLDATDGTERPGFPKKVAWDASLALGDLDRDGVEELVVTSERDVLVFRPDGTALSDAWPAFDPGFLGPPVLADVDGDAYPEVVVVGETWPYGPNPLVPATMGRPGRAASVASDGSVRPQAYPSRWYQETVLFAMDRNGVVVRSWMLMGAMGNQPTSYSTPVVGDFDGDGTTDIAVTYQLVTGGGTSGHLDQGVGVVLTTGAAYSPAANDWPAVFANARNTSALVRRDAGPPTVAITSPAPEALLSGPVAILAEAADDGGVARVEFLVDGAAIGEDATAPYAVLWQTSTAAAGPHTLVARAFDRSGRVAASAPVPVSVIADAAPQVSLVAPVAGARVEGPITLTASASDDNGVVRVDFLVDGVVVGSSAGEPFAYAWDSATVLDGLRSLTAMAVDTAGNTTESDPVAVAVANGRASYDEALQAPLCPWVVASCDSGTLVDGRGPLGPEPHAPNTIHSSCADWPYGTYHVGGSNDRLRVVTLNGSPLKEGGTVRVEATVWSQTGGFADNVDLYSATDATSPAWTYLTTLRPGTTGAKTVSTTFALPAGGLQAVRARYRYWGYVGPCGAANNDDDSDDLAFAVQPNRAPVAAPGGPYAGWRNQGIAFDGRGSTDPDGDPLTFAWTFGDGSSGTGPTPSHAFSLPGTYTVTLVVSDGLATSSPATATATVENRGPLANAGGPYTGLRGVPVAFDGRASSDPDGDPLTYLWDFGDGATGSGATGSGATPTHAYPSRGTYTVTLVVSDGWSSSAPATANVTIQNSPPIARPGGPYSGSRGLAVTFDGSLSSDPDGDPLTYSWDFGDGNTGSGVTPSHVYALSGLYVATLRVNDGGADSAPASADVTIGVVVFREDVEKGVASWTIEGSNGTGGPALWHVATHRYGSPTHAFYYGIDAKKTYNSGARNYGTLSSGPIDLAGASGSFLSFRHFLQKEASTTYDKATILVSRDGGATWILLGSLAASPSLAPQRLSLAAYDGQAIRIRFSFDTVDAALNDYEGWVVDDIVVAADSRLRPPTANAGGPYAAAQAQPISFDGSGSSDPDGDPLSYAWDFGDGATGTGVSPTHAYATLGNFTVTLVVSDGTASSAPATALVTIANQTPVAVAGGPYGGVRNQAIAFNGGGSSDPDGDPLSYQWDFGDGATGTGVSPTHAYATLGDFTVILVVNDGTASSAPATAVVTITNQAPVAAAGGPYGGVRNQAIAFSGISSSDPDGDPLTYQWDFGDGATGTGVSPTHAYATLGNFTVTLVVNDGTASSAPATAIVTITNQTPVAAAGGPYDGVRNEAIVLRGSGSSDADDDPLTYQWNFGDGATGTGVSPTHAYGSLGDFTVTLVVSDGTASSAPATAIVTITNQTPVAAAGGPYGGVRNQAIAFNGGGSSDADGDPLTYQWDFGDGATGTGVSLTHAYATLGNFTVTLVVNDGTASSAPATAVVTITNQAPVAAAGGPYGGVRNQAIAFNGGGSSDADGDPLTYQWDFGDGATGTGVSPTHAYATLGNFTVTLVVNDGTASSAPATAVVTITNQAPVASAGGPYSGVRNQAFAFNGGGSSDADGDPLTYQWDFGDGATGTGVSPTHAYATLGNFTVTTVVNDGTASSAPATALVTIANQAPVAVAGGPYSGVRNQAILFSGSGSSDADGDPLTYQWDFGDGATGAGVSPTHAYTAVGSFTVTLVVNDGTASSAPATALVTIANQAPTVALTSPGPGSLYHAPAVIVVAAAAADPDGSISRVEFFQGAAKIGEAVASPYAITWNAVAAGSYSLTAVAWDDRGASVSSTPVAVLVNAPPTVTLTSPAPGTAYIEPAAIQLTAAASDSDGAVVQVEYFRGSTSLGVATASPYALDWTDVPAGNYALTARATDDRGAVTTSVVVLVVVRARLHPAADAYVRDGASNRSRNFGGALSLQVQNGSSGNNRWTYLKFDTSGTPTATTVRLRLFGRLSATTSTTVTTSVFPCSNTSWGEGSITWNNRPTTGTTALASVTMANNSVTPRWYEWDATAYVLQERAAGRNVVTLVLKNLASSSPFDTFDSSEAPGSPPELLITP